MKNEDKYLKKIFFEIHEDLMDRLRNENIEYSNLITINEEEHEKIQEILKSISKEYRQVILKNKENINRVEWIEREALYFKGYRDCVKLLGALGII